jgi:hypothetical protein
MTMMTSPLAGEQAAGDADPQPTSAMVSARRRLRADLRRLAAAAAEPKPNVLRLAGAGGRTQLAFRRCLHTDFCYGHARPQGGKMSEDPIIEAIRLHQAADQRLDQLDDTVGADEDASQAAADAEHAAFWALFKTPPTSLAGFQELFAYLGQKREFGDCLLSHAIDYWSDGPDDDNEHHPDEATWMRTLADAMARISLLRDQ